MKTFVPLLVAFLIAAPFALAQENYGTIHVTTKLRPDGSKSTTKLDPDSHTAEETITDASNRVQRKTVYTLGENDVAVSATFYDGKGNAVYKATYTRDGAGRVTAAAFNTPDGRYLGKRLFVYTGSGDATQVIDYDANGQQIAAAQPVAPKGRRKH